MAFGDMGKLAVGLAALAITLTIAFLVVAEGQDQVVTVDSIDESNTTQWTTSYNATRDVADGMAGVPGWVPLIVITVIGAMLLGLVKMFRR